MAYIKVNHEQLESTANEVDNYINLMKNKMIEAQAEIETLNSNWQGSDNKAFNNKWNEITANGSVYAQMINSLEGYRDYLRYAASKYKEAQASAVNSASFLLRY